MVLEMCWYRYQGYILVRVNASQVLVIVNKEADMSLLYKKSYTSPITHDKGYTMHCVQAALFTERSLNFVKYHV